MSKTCSQEATFTVVCGPICFDNGNPPGFDTTFPGGDLYSFQLVPHEPPIPPFGVYHFDIVAGALPPGLSLNANTGLISGQAIAGVYLPSYTFTVAVSGTSCPCSKDYTIVAQCHPDVSESLPVVADIFNTVAGTDVFSPAVYFCQRTGAPKNITFSTHLILRNYAQPCIDANLTLYDSSNVPLMPSGINISSGGGADDCTPSDWYGSGDPHVYPLTSCLVYHFIAKLSLCPNPPWGTNPNHCVQTLQCTISW